MAKKVYIDPGHGGHDPGAVDGLSLTDHIYTEEEDLNLALSLLVNTALERCGFLTKMSRTTDVYPSLSARSSGANTWGADIFLSIHFNAAGSTARGVEILYHSGSTQGKRLSQNIFPFLAATTPWSDRTVRADTRGLHVLRATNMPAALVEAEFITNVEAEILVNTPQWQLLAGEAIAQGVCAYFGVKYIPNGSAIPSPPTPAPAPATRPVLKKGSTGTAVKTLQNMLMKIGYVLPKYGADGDFGAETESAVISFQRVQRITADGVVGKDTWYKLDVAYAAALAPKPVEPIPVPNTDTASIIVSRGRDLDDVEKLLKDNGVFGLAIYNLGESPMVKALNPGHIRMGEDLGIEVNPENDVLTIAVNRMVLTNKIDAGITAKGIYGINVYNFDAGGPKSKPLNPNNWR